MSEIQPKLAIVTLAKTLVDKKESEKIYTKQEKKHLVFKAEQGLPGPPGPVGPGGDVSLFVCGESISFGDVLYFNEDGKGYKAGSDLVNMIDRPILILLIAQETKERDESISCRYRGELHYPSSSLTPFAPYYLGLEGAITLTPPTTGILVTVGIAKTSTTLIVRFGTPILLRG